MNSNVLDIIAIATIAFFMLNGMRKGLVAEVFIILGVIVGILLAVQNIEMGSAIVRSVFASNENVEKVLGFILIFMVVMGISMLLAKFVNNVLKVVVVGWIDKTGGVLFGGLKGALIVSSFLPILAFLPDNIAFVKDARDNSFAYAHWQFRGFAPKVYDYVIKAVPGSDSFATKLKEAFPVVSGLPGLGEGSSFLSENQLKQLMGMEEGEMLKAVNKAMASAGSALTEEEVKKILEKYQNMSEF